LGYEVVIIKHGGRIGEVNAMFLMVALPGSYSSSQISVWRSRNRKGSPWLCLALTPPSPRGGFAQKVGFEANLLTFNDLNLSTLLSILNFWAKPPEGEGE
jgi:hypothetical protein